MNKFLVLAAPGWDYWARYCGTGWAGRWVMIVNFPLDITVAWRWDSMRVLSTLLRICVMIVNFPLLSLWDDGEILWKLFLYLCDIDLLFGKNTLVRQLLSLRKSVKGHLLKFSLSCTETPSHLITYAYITRHHWDGITWNAFIIQIKICADATQAKAGLSGTWAEADRPKPRCTWQIQPRPG